MFLPVARGLAVETELTTVVLVVPVELVLDPVLFDLEFCYKTKPKNK